MGFEKWRVGISFLFLLGWRKTIGFSRPFDLYSISIHAFPGLEIKKLNCRLFQVLQKGTYKQWCSCCPTLIFTRATGMQPKQRRHLYGSGMPYHENNTLHEFQETCHSVTLYFMKKDSRRRCDTTTPESIHTKDESKRGSAFAFIFGVNWPVKWM